MAQYLSLHKNKSQTAQLWLCRLERHFSVKQYGEVQAQVNHMVKFCGRYGLHEFKFEAELLLVEVYLAVGDGGQAMVLISQILASLEQYPNQYVQIKVSARFTLAMIKFKRGETMFAYEEVTRDVLPYALEHGTKRFKMRVISLLAKVTL